jgi:histidine triad (HIT) family protein
VSCPFCDIAAGRAPANVVRDEGYALVIEPLEPVALGHLLAIPRAHVADALAEPVLAGAVFALAAEVAERPCNLIASAGPEATQTVMHLHVHVVPRRAGDGLALPWSA